MTLPEMLKKYEGMSVEELKSSVNTVRVGGFGDTDVYKDDLGVYVQVDGETVWCSDEEGAEELASLLKRATVKGAEKVVDVPTVAP